MHGESAVTTWATYDISQLLAMMAIAITAYLFLSYHLSSLAWPDRFHQVKPVLPHTRDYHPSLLHCFSFGANHDGFLCNHILVWLARLFHLYTRGTERKGRSFPAYKRPVINGTV